MDDVRVLLEKAVLRQPDLLQAPVGEVAFLRRASAWRMGQLDGFSECVRRSLQAFTDLGQFSRREINALLLDFRALSNCRELIRHLVYRPCELSQLTGNARYVLSRCHIVLSRCHIHRDSTPMHVGRPLPKPSAAAG